MGYALQYRDPRTGGQSSIYQIIEAAMNNSLSEGVVAPDIQTHAAFAEDYARAINERQLASSGDADMQ